MGEVVHVFVDTSVALHFRRADQIDWRGLTSAPEVVLVVAPVLLRELEREKVHNASRKLRVRAGEIVRWLATFLRDASPPPVRPGVTLEFLDHEPQVDFAAQRLSLSIADDQLIASALEFKAGGDQRVVVCTADVGLEAKLRSRRIEPLLLPQELKLPAEPDALEQELRQTRRKLQRLEARLPSLRLTFKKEADRLEFSFQAVRARPNAPTLSEMQTRHPPLKFQSDAHSETLPESQRKFVSVEHLFLSEQIDKYNRQLPQFYDAYSAYLEELAAWEEQDARTFKLELVLSNRGSAPASDIDAILNFPYGLEIMKDENLPKRPNSPNPPVRPSRSFHLEIPVPTLPNVDPIFFGPYVEQQQVRFSLGRLKHGFDEPLQSFYFRFPARSAVRSFSIDFELSAAELPDVLSGKLHVIVSTDQRL